MPDPQNPLSIVYLSLDEIKPWDDNPRNNEPAVEDVMASIEEFGMIIPIVVNAEYEIKAGHTRVLACKRLGRDSVPAIVVDHLSREQQDAFAIADNKTSSIAAWDDAKLVKIFESLKESGYDLAKTAFKATEIDALMGGWHSDIAAVEKTLANTDGIAGKVVITCPQEMVAELKQFLITSVQDSGFEGVEID